MRIPLDYYRILGVPIQATSGQLKQAYQDRSLQLPRREYSHSAIAVQKHLFEEAYQILSNSEQRQNYDAQFFVPLSDPLNQKDAIADSLKSDGKSDAHHPDPYFCINDNTLDCGHGLI